MSFETSRHPLCNSKDMMREIFAFLEGWEIIEKIALINKEIRWDLLPRIGFLEESRSVPLNMSDKKVDKRKSG
jgi:hypothetical protein